MKSNILLLFVFVGCCGIQTVHGNQSTQGDDQSDSASDAPKTALYAYFGAIEQGDWNYVYNHSTEEARKERIYAIIMCEALTINEELTRIVNEHVDLDQLNQPHEEVANHSEWTPQQLIAFTWEATSDHQELFEQAQAVIPASKLDLPLSAPREIQSWQVSDTTATATCVRVKYSYNHVSNQEVEVHEWFHEDTIVLKKVDDQWLIASCITQEEMEDTGD